MTALVNQDTNSDSNLVNTYLNYVNAVVGGESTRINNGYDLTGLLTTAWGDVRTAWAKHASTNHYWALRFPGISESLSGNITTPTNQNLTAGSRALIAFGDIYDYMSHVLNSTNGTSLVSVSTGPTIWNVSTVGSFGFAVVNAYALCLVAFTSSARTSCRWFYLGWARNGAYTDNQFPRNLIYMEGTNTSVTFNQRVNTENLTTTQTLYSTSDLGGAGILNPVIDCSVATPGADWIEVMIRDSNSPYNYIGQPYFLVQAPASYQIGKIYKNLSMSSGVDWEGSSNAFWMCIGVWGGRKLLMRVWTEGIT